MSEDSYSKTEEPTPRKLIEVRKKGLVIKSQDLTISLLLFAPLAVFYFFGTYMCNILIQMLQSILHHMTLSFDNVDVVTYWCRIGLMQFLWFFAPLFIATLFMGVAANLLQFGFLFSWTPLHPKWKKLNIFDLSNYKENFSFKTIIRLGFGLFRLIAVIMIAWTVISSDLFAIYRLSRGSIQEIVGFLCRELFLIAFISAAVYLVMGCLDYAIQRWYFMRSVRMTRREVKEELKLIQGDIKIKSKMRRLMEAFMQRDVRQDVRRADVIITDGDACAVAIRYHAGEMAAPYCVCKGAQQRALKIKECAQAEQICIVDRPHLARNLYRLAGIDRLIPEKLYHEVAEVLAEAESKQKRINHSPVNEAFNLSF